MLKSILKSSIFVLVISCVAQATVFHVPEDAATIQDAVWLCLEGDTIELTANTTYKGWGNRDIKLYGRKITVRSENPDDPQVVASTVIDCEGLGRGFALDSGETADTLISGITIRNGKSFLGGGLYFSSGSFAKVTNCVIENCYADLGGAIAVSNGGSSPIITNCQIIGNTARIGGGAVYIIGGSATMENCIISNNYAERGGAFYSHNPGSSVISHCTVVGNVAELDAGAMYCYNARDIVLYGSIFWNNTSQSEAQIQIPNIAMATKVQISYCNIAGMDENIAVQDPSILEWGVGNIQADPMFTTSQAVVMLASTEGANVITDFTLDEDSPCVDMGDPGYNSQGKKDVYGKQRLFGDLVDIGASEFAKEDVIEAKVKIWPKVINLRGKQNYMFCTIKLDGYETKDIDTDTLLLQDAVKPVSYKKFKRVKELVLRFKMSDVRELVDDSQKSITLKVTGLMKDTEVPFEGEKKVKVYQKKGKGHHKHEEIFKKLKDFKDKHDKK